MSGSEAVSSVQDCLLEHGGEALGYFVVLAHGVALFLRLVAQQVTMAGLAAHELATSGHLETLRDGFLCLLHGYQSIKTV